MSKILLALTIISILALFNSCKNKNEIKKEKLANIYVEVLISQEKNKNDFAKADSIKKVIYKKYGVSSEQYQSTLESYGSDQKKWDDFFKLVNERIEELQKKNKSAR